MSQNEIESIKNKLTRVLFLIDNDNATGTKGLVQEVRDIRIDLYKLIDSIMLERERRKVWSVVFGAIGASIVWIVQKILSHFI